MLQVFHNVTHCIMRALGARSVYVPTSVGDVHLYEADGPGARTFVLIHGIGTASTSYASLFRGLRARARRLILVDLPGHGRGRMRDAALTKPKLLAGAHEALDAVLQRETGAVLGGTSLGGAVALDYALLRPQRIGALVLLSPGGAPLTKAEIREVKRRFRLRSKRDARRFFSELMHRPPIYTRLFERELLDVLARPTVQGFLANLAPEDCFDAARLAPLGLPVLVVWGKSDRIMPRSGLAFYRNALPAGTIFEEPDEVGHTPHIERPDYVLECLLRFS
ncbi:MAG: alpha/beta fold hydrolase [Polyangiaceae bacterium]|nr:alpha/beta fold hydrolase [Polyangiaceae bacterium]